MTYIPASMLPILLALLSCHVLLSQAGGLQGLKIARRGVLSVPDLSDAAERRHFALARRQSAPDCGAQGGNRRCPNNLCCSDYGWCGDGPDYCDVRWCQAQFGRCGDAPPPEPTTSTTSTTSSRSSTTTRPTTSSTSTSTSTSTLPPPPGGTMIVSPNGLCGNITTCAGSAFGDCCSEWYWCGNGPEYCAAGCRSAFGSCGGAVTTSSTTATTATSTSSTSTRSSSTSTSAAPRPSDASRDGRCGEENGRQRCTGSGYGPCCSQFGWCGDGPEYCDARTCQADWGICGGEGGEMLM